MKNYIELSLFAGINLHWGFSIRKSHTGHRTLITSLVLVSQYLTRGTLGEEEFLLPLSQEVDESSAPTVRKQRADGKHQQATQAQASPY